MTISENIVLNAKNNASPAFKGLAKDANQATADIAASSKRVTSAGKEMGDSLQRAGKSVKLSFTELNSAISLAERGFQVAQQFIEQTAGVTLEYANQVRQLKTAIGSTPEEASKLIQVADDMGVSFGTLTQSLEGAIRKGVKPTISGIAELSDKYLALQPGVERTKFLMDNFGRSGADMARLMELGSKAIDEMGESLEGTARVMDEEALQAADEYRLALDELGDAAEDVKIKVGRGLIPSLTEFLKLFTSPSAEQAGEVINTVFAGTIWETAEHKMRRAAEAAGFIAAGSKDMAESLREVDAAAKPATASTGEYIAAMARMNEEDRALAATAALAANIGKVDENAQNAASSIKVMLDQTDRNIGNAISDLMADLDWRAAGGGTIESLFGNIKGAIESGKITEAEGDQLLGGLFVAEQNLQMELNNITADEAAQNVSDTLGVSLTEAKSILDSMKNMDLGTIRGQILLTISRSGAPVTSYPNGGGPFSNPAENMVPDAGGAHGLSMTVPPGYPGDSFLVGTTSGERVEVTPKGQAAGGGTNITLNINAPGADPQAVADVVMQRLMRAQRGGAGLAYAGRA
jgi:hypothetical protein